MLLIRSYWDRDHLARDEFRSTHTAVEPPFGNIDQSSLGPNFEAHCRLQLHEAGQKRHQHLLGCIGVAVDPHEFGGSGSLFVQLLDCQPNFAESWHESPGAAID